MGEEQRLDMEGDCNSTDALDDGKLCVSMAGVSVGISEHATATNCMPSSSRPMAPGFIGSIPSRSKRKRKRRRENAARGVLAQQESIGKEGECKSADALDDAKLCVLVPSTAERISEYVTTVESMPSSSSTQVGFASTSGFEPSPSTIISSRIERMMELRSEYASAVELEIEASREHWSQLDPRSEDEEETLTERLEIFESLQDKWGVFFKDHGDRLVVGEKIAEGGLAEIFEAEVTTYDGFKDERILKVFKEGWALRDLQKQWPHGMLQNRPNGGAYYTTNSALIFEGTMLKDGRFAFVMYKYWGDLRKVVDVRMQHNHNQSPPFTNKEVGDIVVQIAMGMEELHDHKIIHRDLKASNVLVWEENKGVFDPVHSTLNCNVADFECSVGVVGTGYWRAPEILLAVQARDIKPHLFTEKSDVYSYAMTCYEVLTGCIPFEELGRTDYDIVIKGKRPELPNHVNPMLKTLLRSCWRANPLKRPSFRTIVENLKKIFPDCYIWSDDDD